MSVTQQSSCSSKKEQKSQVNNFLYELYECVYLLRVKKFSKSHGEQSLVDIVLSSFYEGSQRCLLVLVCSNGSLLLYLREGSERPITKQLNWFQNPTKKIVALCIDPLRGAWVLCACLDSSLYLIPALAQLKDSTTLVNAQHTWSQTDLSRIPFSRTLKGRVVSIIWWHTLDDRNVGIIGTDNGELVFLDISQHQEIDRTSISDKITRLELLQDINNRTTELFIFTAKNWTLQLLLEQPSQTTDLIGSSSLTQGYDMGYDMVTDCNVDSILVTSNENKEEIQTSNRLEILPKEFQYSIHNLNENVLIGKFDGKYHTFEIYSDIKRVPEYVYYIPQNPSLLLLSEDLMFTVTDSGENVALNILSRQLSTSSYGRQGSKRQDSSRQIALQTFNMIPGEQILNCYKAPFHRQQHWNELFPHNGGYKEECYLSTFFIVTKNGLLECRPRISPEHYFTELAVKHGTDVAEKIGVTLDLNVSLLYEFLADKLIAEKDVQSAVKFYNLSKCSPIKRSLQLVEFSSVTDGLIHIKQVLKKPPSSLPTKNRKQLSNMAILCYVEQILNNQKTGSFSKTLADSFRSFICDNFDYDEQLAMDLLVSHGMIDNLFEVAKTRGKIEDALENLSLRGLFLLPQSVQNMLLDRGYADLLCKASNGIFLKHMQPEEVVKFMLSQPNITVFLISTLAKLLLKFEETSLLQIARVFDPSRQFIKPILDKLDKRKRSGSGLSLSSLASSISIDDPNSPTPSDIIVMFLKTIITLNSKRKTNELPDVKLISRHLTGQCSWSGSIYMRSDSISSTELIMSEMSRVKIACGRHHIAYVTGENELYTWGRASSGRLGHGDLVEERATSQPMRVESLQMHGIQVLSVACGALHTIVLCHEGVFAWGSNRYGQLGIGDKRKRTRPVIISELSSKQIHSVVCGQYHSIALTNDYNAYAWGWGVHGQLGLGSVENQLTPQPITLLHGHRVIQVAAGYGHSAVLTSRGQVFTFGAGLYGQLGIGVNTKRTTPQLVGSLTNDMIYLIACGSFETLAVADDQTIFCWGRNYHQFHICGKAESASYGRQMASNTSDISHRYLPEDLPFKLQQAITQLVCGNWHYIALTSMNIVYTWGCNDCGQLGHYNKIDQPAPRLVKALSRKRIVGIAAGCEFSVAVDDENQVLAWGRADGGLVIKSLFLRIFKYLGYLKYFHLFEFPEDWHRQRKSSRVTSSTKIHFSVLAPTTVPGLPIHFDQVSIDSNHSYKREFIFDQTYELPDLSSVGRDKAPYNYEAVLLSLYKLAGLYNTEILVQFAYQVKEWFVLSFCYELQEKWDEAFTYRAKAVLDYYVSSSDKIDFQSYSNNMLMVVADLLNKFEDHLPEEFEEDCSFVSMVSGLKKILDYWVKENFSVQNLEDLLRQRMEPLCPLYAIVFFGFVGKVNRMKSSSLRFALYKVSGQHPLLSQLSNAFLNSLLAHVIIQMDSGSTWYTFLSCSSAEMTVGEERIISVPVGESTLSRDQMLKEIIEHKQKILNSKPFISLSNAVAATLAAASTAQRVESSMADPLGLHMKVDQTVTEQQPDSVVFSCGHNLPRYYMLETVIPELESRMAELPVTLANTGKVLAEFYKQFEFRIPLACPYCVYNNLRNEQLRVLRESGNDFINDRSTLWEI